jgi:hypothetical protein
MSSHTAKQHHTALGANAVSVPKLVSRTSGGTVEVFSGGTLNGATIGGGVLELQNGATAGSSTIDFASGTLRLDATGACDFVVEGFASSDTIDLSAINFVSATKQYSGNTSSGTLTVGDGTQSVSPETQRDHAACLMSTW